MQTYTYSPSFNYSYTNGSSTTSVTLPTIVDACSTYVGTKGLNIQCGTKTGFIPIVANTNSNASCVKICMNSTTCAFENLQPYAYFCATACSCAYVSDSYDPGTYTTYIKGFTFCYRDPNHNNCPFALDYSYCVCLYTDGIGWKCMGSIACGCWQMTASTYQFANNCKGQWRCTQVYLYDATGFIKIGCICTYMPSKPSAGETKCCVTNCNGTTNILNWM